MNIFGFNVTRAQTASDLVIAAEAQRSASSGLADPAPWLREALGAYGTASGVTLSEEGAMRLRAVFSCVRVLAEDVSSLPLKLYRRDGRTRELATDHALYPVLHRMANPLMSAMVFREVMMVHLTLWGNAYAEVQRNGRGDVVALWPILPRLVTVEKDTSGPEPRRRYRVAGVGRPFRQQEVFHVAGLGFDGLQGKSPIRLMRESLGIAVSAERYGAKFFANDARPGIYLKHPAALGDVAYNRLKQEHNDQHQGTENAWRVKILEEGMDVAQVGLPPGDAQFIETRKYERGEIAGIYRVPPHMIGDLERATFSNIEHQSLGYVMHTLRPWLVRFEQAVGLQLLGGGEQDEYYAEHNVAALLRGDVKSRFEAYAVGRNWGWLSADDVRELENMNPLPDGQGDVYLQPLNMVPAGSDMFGEGASPAEPPTGDGSRTALPRLGGRRLESRALPSRVTAARGVEPAIAAAIARAVRREASEIRKALGDADVATDEGRAAFEDWLVEFCDGHPEWMAARTYPAYRLMAEVVAEAAADEIGDEVDVEDLDPFVRDYALARARRHAGSTRGQVLGLLEAAEAEARADAVEEHLDEWVDGTDAGTRAEKESADERRRSAGAITVAAWAFAGVASYTWRTSGKNCPFCDGLDGTTISMGSAFARAGDQVGTEAGTLEVASDTTHAPLHRGCDCYVVPGGGARRRRTSAEVRSVLAGLLVEAAGDRPECARGHHAVAGGVHGPTRPATWVQRRNAWIQAHYRTAIAARYGEREIIIGELQSGEFEGRAYELAFSTCRKICDNGSA